MYYQDCLRLKSTLLNNVAACFFNQKKIKEAEQFNDLALIEDPGYAKAHHRKCLILEANGQLTSAISIAQAQISEYQSEFEFDESNKAMIPKFEAFIKKVKPNLYKETEQKQNNLQKEVDDYLAHTMPSSDFLDELFPQDEEEKIQNNVPEEPQFIFKNLNSQLWENCLEMIRWHTTLMMTGKEIVILMAVSKQIRTMMLSHGEWQDMDQDHIENYYKNMKFHTTFYRNRDFRYSSQSFIEIPMK